MQNCDLSKGKGYLTAAVIGEILDEVKKKVRNEVLQGRNNR